MFLILKYGFINNSSIGGSFAPLLFVEVLILVIKNPKFSSMSNGLSSVLFCSLFFFFLTFLALLSSNT